MANVEDDNFDDNASLYDPSDFHGLSASEESHGESISGSENDQEDERTE